MSYSYGAPHNAPAHKGQFCNAKFFSTYFLKNRILPRLSVIFDSRGQIKVITSSRCFLLKEAHPERAILFSDKLDSIKGQIEVSGLTFDTSEVCD